MSLKFFGTDGIRGEYGSDVLNDEIAFRAGRAAVRTIRQMGLSAEALVAVGRDTRQSGAELARSFARGVASEGGRLIDLGVAPTPCVAYATRHSSAALGCVITASHNPAKDNGIKFFDENGVKPSEELEQALDDGIAAVDAAAAEQSAQNALTDGKYLVDKYVRAILAFFPKDMLAGKRVALDCANGAMSGIAPQVFETLGAKVKAIGFEPNGANINLGVGSECPDSLKSLYSDSSYDLGFAFDGDGDRVMLSDESGNRVAGEALLAVLAIEAKESGRLSGNTLVTTVQSNLGLDAALADLGISVQRTDVGDKHIARLMLAEGYSIGGEESGHLVLGDFAVTGDGLTAAVKLAEIVARSGQSISELASVFKPFPQESKAVRVAAKPSLSGCRELSRQMKELTEEFGPAGRLLVRYSGTEPKLRLLVEAETEGATRSAMQRLLAAAETDLEIL